MNINYSLKIFSLIIFLVFSNKIVLNFSTKEVSNKGTSLVIKYIDDYKKEIKIILDLCSNYEYDEALKKAFILLNNIDKNDFQKKSEIKTLIAKIYNLINANEFSLKYYKDALKELNLSNKKAEGVDVKLNSDLLEIHKNIGIIYTKLSSLDHDKSDIYLDSAKVYYFKVENSPALNDEAIKLKASVLNNLSGIYQKDSLFEIAESYTLKAIDLYKKVSDPISHSITLNNLGNINMSKGEFQKAKKHYLEGINLIKDDETAKAIETKADLYYNLAWAMRNLKEYEAYDYQEKSYLLTDKMRDKDIRRIVEEISAQYNVQNARKEEINKRLLGERRFLIFITISTIIIISLAFFTVIYYQRRKTLALKLKETQLVQLQKIENLKTEMQNRILSAAIDSKEKERKEISEILHDSVSSLLSSANLHLQATKSRFNGSTPDEIEKTQAILSEASTKVRNLSHSLVSSTLLKFGLQYAVKDLAQKFSNSTLKITYEIHNINRYSQKFEIKIHNILQECINNIIKHSEATLAEINLSEENGMLNLMVFDNGKGFDKTKVISQNGIGISEIEVRIQMMKGNFYIDSKEKEGTKILIKVPIFEKKPVISA